MKQKRISAALLTGVVTILALALVVGPATARKGDGTRSFHGTVTGIAKNKKSLTISRNGGSRIRFAIRASTTYEHVRGISQISRGTPVEVHAFRSEDRWIATRIETNPGRDDSGGHGSDDPPGDDHGSGGHGADD